MNETISLSDAQFQKLLAVLDAAKGGIPWATVIPVFISAALAICVGIGLEYFKRYLEKKKKQSDKRKDELDKLNVAATAIGFNIENLTHIVMQQILPHLHGSRGAMQVFSEVKNDFQTMNFQYIGMMTRCPEPHFVYIDFFKDVPFVLAKDPELLKRSAWIEQYIRALKEIIFERNKRIDVAAAAPSDPIDILALEEQIRVQCHLADTEVVNSFCLFEQMIIIRNKLKAVTLTYPKKPGPCLVPLFPAPLKDILDQLRALCETVVPNMQPHETEASLED